MQRRKYMPITSPRITGRLIRSLPATESFSTMRSPRRGETFVTRKITRAATRIKLGMQKKLYLGNLEAKRDWGYAGDYVEAMWLMLQQEKPDDYAIATGETHSVREFVEKVFAKLDMDYHDYVEIDPKYFRPTEVDVLLGDSTKAQKALNWKPKVTFEKLVEMMIATDMEMANKEKTLLDAGYPKAIGDDDRHGYGNGQQGKDPAGCGLLHRQQPEDEVEEKNKNL